MINKILKHLWVFPLPDVPKTVNDIDASVEELLTGISKTQYIDMAMLEKIVATDNKQRYSFNEDKTLIRAN